MENQIKECIEPILKEHGFMVDSVIYEKEDNNYFLRITIDKIGVITVDDCVVATKLINPILDEKDFIENSYILEVSSKERGDLDEQ